MKIKAVNGFRFVVKYERLEVIALPNTSLLCFFSGEATLEVQPKPLNHLLCWSCKGFVYEPLRIDCNILFHVLVVIMY